METDPRLDGPRGREEAARPDVPGPAPLAPLRFITRDPATLALLDEVRSAAPLPVPVLLRGETGTGKELLARSVHEESGRGARPFVAVNAAALPEQLFESSLVGHVKGAFTGAQRASPGLFAAAGNGTIFLDEIGELGPAPQAKLLRVLDRGEYRPVGGTVSRICSARVVAATNRDLDALSAEGRFRRDLLYRLSMLTVMIPPLRRRPCDIAPLAEHMLERLAAHQRTARRSISHDALALLARYRWPGNVRELEAELLGAMVRARGPQILSRHLSRRLRLSAAAREDGERYGACGESLDERVDRFVCSEIVRALERAGGNKTEAARLLGIKRTTLIYRMRRLGISSD